MHIYIENKIGQTFKLKKVMTKDDLLMNANEQYHGAFFVVWRLLTITTEVFMMMVTPISTFIVGCTANKKATDLSVA